MSDFILPLSVKRGEGQGEGPRTQLAPHPTFGRPLPALQGEVWLLVMVVLLSGCAKCGAPKPVADAGARASQKLAPPKHSADLRTAIIYIYPEYRGTALLDATATLTRTIPGLTDATRDEALKTLRYEPAEDGGWAFSTFHLSQPAADQLSLLVTFDTDHLAQLYVTPTGLSSMELGQYLPRNLPAGAERFTFDVHYVSSPDRSRELVRQAATLLQANAQWKLISPPLDWVDGSVPDAQEEVRLEGPMGAAIRLTRRGGHVETQYALDTR